MYSEKITAQPNLSITLQTDYVLLCLPSSSSFVYLLCLLLVLFFVVVDSNTHGAADLKNKPCSNESRQWFKQQNTYF